MTQQIELDCAPFQSRPDTLINGVIEYTDIPLRRASSMRFGKWTWDYADIPSDQWERAVPEIKKRIIELFEHHLIRYGAWE